MSLEAAIRVTILQAEGSTPRAAGAVMHVTRQRVIGTIGGGQMEWQAVKAAKQMLDDGSGVAELELALGPSLRQCCGGRVKLALERTDQALADIPPAGAPKVIIFGGGHVGRALLHVLQPLPWHLTLVDPRPDYLPEPTPRLNVVHAQDLPAAVSAGPSDAAWVVTTHEHELDLDVVDAVLRRDEFRWLGLIGSMTKRRTFERRLLARGHSSSALARLTCPMGVRSIQDKHPAAIAVSIAAELLSLPINEESCR
jgi:xanthine dehydrogenase accessory factor